MQTQEILSLEYEENLLAQSRPETQAAHYSPGPSLDSAWYLVKGRNVFAERTLWLRTLSLSAAPDDTLWFGTDGFGVHMYSAAQEKPDYVQIAKPSEGAAVSLAAISARVAWAVLRQGQTTRIARLEAGQSPENVPPLPGAKPPHSVAAASDGTVWALSTDGSVFALSEDRRAWKAVETAPYTITRIAIGSATNIRALSAGSHASLCLNYTHGKGWEREPQGSLTAPTWLAACRDGSAWAREGNRFFVSESIASGWREVKGMTANPEPLAELNAAGSALCCYTRHPKAALMLFGAYKRGVLSLEPRSWPAQSDKELAAYRAIGAKLGITIEGGIRAQYPSTLAPFESFHATLTSLDRPPDIEEAAWKTVKAQILNELTYVSAAHRLFASMSRLTNSLGIVNAAIPPVAGLLVGLDLNLPEHQNTPVPTYVYSMWRTVLDVMLGLVPFPYNMATSLLNTAVFMAIDELTQERERPENPNYSFPIRFADLGKRMNSLYLSAVARNGNILTSIVRDWGKLRVVGEAIVGGVWQWNPQYDDRLVQAAAHNFEVWFYRSLVAARWQVLITEYVMPARGGRPEWVAQVPGYLIAQDGAPTPWHRSGHDYLIWKYRICNSLGNRSYPPPVERIGPFPTQPLFAKLAALGQSAFDVLFGQNGWNLKVFRWDEETQLAAQGYLTGESADPNSPDAEDLFSPPPQLSKAAASD